MNFKLKNLNNFQKKIKFNLNIFFLSKILLVFKKIASFLFNLPFSKYTNESIFGNFK